MLMITVLLQSTATLLLTDTLFTGIGDGSINYEDAAIRFQGSDTVLEMSGNTFTGNANDVIMLEAGAMMGHDTTLTPQNGLDGYVLESDFTVPPTVTLTIEPGVTVRGNRGWKQQCRTAHRGPSGGHRHAHAANHLHLL